MPCWGILGKQLLWGLNGREGLQPSALTVLKHWKPRFGEDIVDGGLQDPWVKDGLGGAVTAAGQRQQQLKAVVMFAPC